MLNRISSLRKLEELVLKSSSDDGESISLELKGTNGEKKFTRDHKKLISKEICAFANTYGGILCFHFGEDSNLKIFPNSVIELNFNSIETWLRDSLEPKLLGIDIEALDGVLLIYIPESKNKPHRTQITADYFYRHSTISQKMPEIMIRSLYQSRGFLSISQRVSIKRIKNLLFLHLDVINESNICGSNPKIQIQLYGNVKKLIEFKPSKYFAQDGGFFKSYKQEFEIKTYLFSLIETNKTFQDGLLYPKDSISLMHSSKPDDMIKNLNHILIRFDCLFKESIRMTQYKLFQLSDSDESIFIMDSYKNTTTEIINKFRDLISIE